jgi:hypothetical protein
MPKSNSEKFFSILGRQVVKSAKDAALTSCATHRIILVKGIKEIASIQVPLEEFKKSFGDLHEAIIDAAGRSQLTMQSSTRYFDGMHIDVVPSKKRG